MGGDHLPGHRGPIAGETVGGHQAKEGEMNHPETMLRLARERQERFHDEARRHDLARQATSIQRQEPRDRFRIRDLRWTLFRPATA